MAILLEMSTHHRTTAIAACVELMRPYDAAVALRCYCTPVVRAAQEAMNRACYEARDPGATLEAGRAWYRALRAALRDAAGTAMILGEEQEPPYA